MWLILWDTGFQIPLAPDRPGSTFLVHVADRANVTTWPTEAEAQAVLDADTSMPKGKAKVVPLSVWQSILDGRSRAAFAATKRRKAEASRDE